MINDNPYSASVLQQPEHFFTKPQLEQLTGLRKIMQIIVGALIAGCLFFAVVGTVVNTRLPEAGFFLDSDHLITMLAVPYVVLAVVASVVIGHFIKQKTPMAGETPTQEEISLAQQQLQTETIIKSALLEGAAFFCLIAWIVDVSYWSLVGAGVCLFLLALKFPREGWHLNEIQRRLKDRS